MTRELLLLRHGKSDWGAGLEDFYRPLKDRGKRGAQRVGVWLARQEWIPDLIISSPAERALVTAEKACKAMGIDASGIRQDKRISDSDAGQAAGAGRLAAVASRLCPAAFLDAS
jgi:phosphohistidine phosphatase